MSPSSLFLKRKLINTIKFLLFKEDNPKHGIADIPSINFMVIILIPCIIIGVSFMAIGYMYAGAIGAVSMYLLYCVLAVEIPHILFER